MQTEPIPVLKADEYPGGIWYYEPHTYQPYRYILGRIGTHQGVVLPAALTLLALGLGDLNSQGLAHGDFHLGNDEQVG